MDPFLVGIMSLLLIVLLIYLGAYVAIALSLVSFLGVWLLRGNFSIAMNMMTLAVTDSIKSYDFASIPTFVMMGLIVGKAGIGTEIYEVAHQLFRRVRGGLGIATVAANAAFAAVTGSSIASASVFTRVSVPEMIRYRYSNRFAVGVVAGSSVLGMLIPPSVMLIIYAFVAEQSVGDMFLAGVVPGLMLSAAFAVAIFAMTFFVPGFVGRGALAAAGDKQLMSVAQILLKLAPLTLLILIVLGGIYSGVVTASEAGAAGALVAFLIAALKRRMSWKSLKEVLIDTGHITAAILFLIMAATMYSRMLGIAGLPSMFSSWLSNAELSFAVMMVLYVVLLLFLGTIIDTSSIILICAPLFLKTIEDGGHSLIWFGIVTVVGAEIGLLTPPFGISCFVIKQTLEHDADISLNDVFAGAFPFAAIMLGVLILLIAFPELSLAILG